MSGLMSIETTSGWASAQSDSARRTLTSSRRSTAASPRKAPSRALVRKSSIICSAALSVSGAGLKTTSFSASAMMPPTPSITVGPNCASTSMPTMNSRTPETISATSRCTSPSAGRAAPSSSVAASRTASSPVKRRRTRPLSVLCAIASPPSLTTTAPPISLAAAIASSAVATFASLAKGRPYGDNRDFESDSDKVRDAIARPEMGSCTGATVVRLRRSGHEC